MKRLFDRVTPEGITPTGEKLEELLLDYLLRLEDAKAAQLAGEEGALKKIKPINIVVITDGEFSLKGALWNVKGLTPPQVNLQMTQNQ